MGKASKAVSKNLGGIIGGVFALAAIGVVGYVILRRDEILTKLDNRFDIGGGASGGATTGTVDHFEIETGSDDISNNDNDSSSPNTSNQDPVNTTSPQTPVNHNTNQQIYQRQQNRFVQETQQQQVQTQTYDQAGYDLSRRVAPRATEEQQYRQYEANKQGFDRAATFQSDPGSLPKHV